MSQIPHLGSGSMPGSQGQRTEMTLCEPLAQLKHEHGQLREQMDSFAREAAEIGMSYEIADWSPALSGLKEMVEAFIRELDPHSEREEEYLFPLMAKYIGRETGPIAVMEFEHEQAKQNLKMFRESVEQVKEPVNTARAKEIASYTLQAHAVLTDHFMKEETVLFPMAENILNAEEKEELSRAFGLS